MKELATFIFYKLRLYLFYLLQSTIMHKKLFIPGPTEVRKEVLQEMSHPVIGHRSSEFSELHNNTVNKLQKIFNTKSPVFLSGSSALGVMEACARNTIRSGRKVLNLVCGAFSEKWAKIFKSNGRESIAIEVDWGKATKPEMVREALEKDSFDAVCLTHNETSTGVTNPLEEIAKVVKEYPDTLLLVDAVSSLAGIPIKVDEWGIDVCLASVQKALAVPPGLAVFSVSEKALKRAGQVENRGTYFDFLQYLKYYEKGQTISTGPISQIFALSKELDIVLKESLENRFRRHEKMARKVKEWANKNFADFAEQGYSSKTLTTVKNTKKLDIKEINEELSERGKVISNGYGKLKDLTFRISHMGEIYPKDIKELLKDLNEILNL